MRMYLSGQRRGRSAMKTVAMVGLMSTMLFSAGCDPILDALCNLPFAGLFLPCDGTTGCVSDEDCSEGLVCDTSSGDCVECVNDSDCDQGFCSEAGGNVCVECISDANCDDGDPCTTDICSSAMCENDEIMCDEGESCVDGECVSDAPEPECTTDDDCADGEICVDGECEMDAPEPDCTTDDDCADGESCVDGECVMDEPEPECTTDDDCADGESCVDGECVMDEAEGCAGLTGDATAGETFYNDNGCSACHGASAEGGIGPALTGLSCDVLLENLNGTDSHPVTVDGVTEQNAADLQAWLDSL